MRVLNIVSLRFRSLLRRRRVERELDEEMRFHVEQQVAANRAAGMRADEARYAALRSFGGLEQMKEECRDARALGWLEDLVRDLRYAARTLRKAPSVSLTGAAALAVGVGALMLVFAVSYSVLWKPLPLPGWRHLVAVREINLRREAGSTTYPVSPPDFLDFQSGNRSFESLAAFQWADRRTLRDSATPDRVLVLPISSDYFRVLRMAPLSGRMFSAEEQQSRAPVALLSYECWQRDFRSDPSLVGRSIRLNDQPFAVVGIMPQGTRNDFSGSADIFVPLSLSGAPSERGDRELGVLGRLRDGVSPGQAEAELNALARQIALQYPASNGNFAVAVIPLREISVSYIRSTLLLLLGAAAFVFVVVCANVANLLLSRGIGRAAEFAVRLSLGARRLALVRQIMAEGVVLALAGFLGGMLLARLGMDVFVHFASSVVVPVPRFHEVSLDAPAYLFAAAAAVFATLTCTAPAALAAGSARLHDMKTAGRSGGGDRRQRRLRDIFVAVEVALALVLMAGAGLFLNSLLRLQRADLGFDPHQVVTAHANLAAISISKPERITAAVDQLLQRAGAAPGAQLAAATTRLPLSGGASAVYVSRTDRPRPRAGEQQWALTASVTPRYFSVLGMRLLRGRYFTDADSAQAPRVILINENLARDYFPGENPVGARMRIDPPGSQRDEGITPGEAQVIGVLANVKEIGVDEVPFDAVYFPFAQVPSPNVSLAVRTLSLPSTGEALSHQLGAQFGPESFGVSTMDELVAKSFSTTRFNFLLIQSFAVLALLLAALGIYAVFSHAVAQRTHEIGVRMALGARPRSMARLIVGRAALLAGCGLAAGLGIVLYLGYAFRDMLYLVPHKHSGLIYQVSAHDPLTLGAACVFVVLITLPASWIPARRAARVDPMVALRYE